MFDNGGKVQFVVDGSNFGKPVALSNGTATIQESTWTVGAHTITATYSGDTDFSGSSSTPSLSQTINADSTTTTISASPKNPNPSLYGQSLTFTSTVANTTIPGTVPTGTVSFYTGSSILATIKLVSGLATYTTSTLNAGSYSITATYNGSTDFTSSSSDPTAPVLQTINPDSTSVSMTASAATVAYDQPVTFTVTVKNTSGTTAVPTGTVTFEDNYAGTTMVLITVPIINGQATFTTSKLGRGNNLIQAVYNPTIDFLPSPAPPEVLVRVVNL
jgi:uncharacterized repeat protein (TIGR01451 family)